jgi:hypothetical protein
VGALKDALEAKLWQEHQDELAGVVRMPEEQLLDAGDSAGRREWERQVWDETRDFRIRVAGQYRQRARMASEPGSQRYYEQRADANRHRPERCADCGDVQAIVECPCCDSVVMTIESRCAHHRMCLRCRSKRAAREQARNHQAFDEQLKEFRLRGLEYTWRPKLLTLTLPHSGDVRADTDVLIKAWAHFRRELTRWLEPPPELSTYKVVRYAEGSKPADGSTVESGLTRRDAGRLKARLEGDGFLYAVRRDGPQLRFVRVLEWTAGKDHQGHAHIHAIVWSPFVPHALLRELWGAALHSLGYAVPSRPRAELEVRALVSGHRPEQVASIPGRVMMDELTGELERDGYGAPCVRLWYPVVDVRAIRLRRGDSGELDGTAAVVELCKYLVKDIEKVEETGEVRRMTPELFALVYEASHERRAIQTSRGYWPERPPKDTCHECGYEGGVDPMDRVRLEHDPETGEVAPAGWKVRMAIGPSRTRAAPS